MGWNIRLEPVAERANAIRPYGILDEIKSYQVIKIQKDEDVSHNQWNPIIRKIRDSEYLISENITLKPVGEKTRSIASLQGGQIISLYQVAFRFVENKAYLMNGHPLPVPIFFRIIHLNNLLKGRIILLW